MSTNYSIGAVIVHFSDWTATDRCVRSLKRGTVVPEIVVIDNDKENIGYGPACNKGAKSLNTDKIIFMNNDSVASPEMVENLAKSEYDYCSPVIKNGKGEIVYFGGEITISGPRHWTTSWTDDIDTGFLQGGCICVKRNRWIGFDPEIFLYFEDVELSQSAKACGISMGVVHNAVLYHDSKPSVTSRYWATRNYRKVMGHPVYYWAWWVPKRVFGLLLKRRPKESLAVLRGAIDSIS